MKRCIQIFNESKELSLGKLAVIHRTSEHEDSGGKPRVENPRICSPMRVQTNNQESKVFNDESGSKQKKTNMLHGANRLLHQGLGILTVFRVAKELLCCTC